MVSGQELSDLMGNVSTIRIVKSARVAGKGNQVLGIVELEGDSDVSFLGDVTMDLVSAINALGQPKIYASWMSTSLETMRGKAARVFNTYDDRTFYDLCSQGSKVLIRPTSEKIGGYSATKILGTYVKNISK
ncbi:MAG: hypothetical protein AABX33_03240 [Nanoarchaeota archaeon]